MTITARSRVHGNPIYVARVYGPGVLTRFDSASVAVRNANARVLAAAPDAVLALRALLDPSPVAVTIDGMTPADFARSILERIDAPDSEVPSRCEGCRRSVPTTRQPEDGVALCETCERTYPYPRR